MADTYVFTQRRPVRPMILITSRGSAMPVHSLARRYTALCITIAPPSTARSLFRFPVRRKHSWGPTRGSRPCRIRTCFQGVLKFTGYVINNNKIPYTPGQPLTDNDFHPDFAQKGVDMRIGIDMANISQNRSADLIALATNDTDCIPAMKHARRSGLQVALVTVPGYQPVHELLAHSDFRRNIAWPA